MNSGSVNDLARSPVFTRCVDAAALAEAGADAIAAAAALAVAAHGEFRLALSGGKTPHATFAALAKRQVDWARTSLFFSDERCVPPDHQDSNFARAREALLQRVPVPNERVYRMCGELAPEVGAAHYESLLRELFGRQSARTFDLCLLGLGSDGHCASLFPASPALEVNARWVTAGPAPAGVMPAWRLTLTFNGIASSQDVLFLVAGADKANIVQALQRGAGNAYPASRVRARGGVRYLVSAEAFAP